MKKINRFSIAKAKKVCYTISEFRKRSTVMKISTNTGFSPDLSTLAEAIPLIRNAGFDCFDLSLFGMKSDDKA